MKRLITLFAVLLFASCQSYFEDVYADLDEDTEYTVADDAICIIASANASRSSIVSSASQMESMGLYCAHTKEMSWSDYLQDLSTPLKFENTKLIYDDDEWVYDDTLLDNTWGFELTTELYTLFAYSPYANSEINGMSDPVIYGERLLIEYIMPEDVDDQPDMLVATPRVDICAPRNGYVDMTFNHTLSAISIELGLLSMPSSTSLTKVELSNFVDSGTLNMSLIDGSYFFDLGSNLRTIDLTDRMNTKLTEFKDLYYSDDYDSSQSTSTKISSDYIMIPPQLFASDSQAKLTIIFTTSETDDDTGETVTTEEVKEYSFAQSELKSSVVYTFSYNYSFIINLNDYVNSEEELTEADMDIIIQAAVEAGNGTVTITGSLASCEDLYYYALFYTDADGNGIEVLDISGMDFDTDEISSEDIFNTKNGANDAEQITVTTLIAPYFGTDQLEAGAFKNNCENLEVLDLSQSGLESFTPTTLTNMGNLKTLILPDTVTKIENDQFKDLVSLETLDFNGNNNITSLDAKILDDLVSLKTLILPTSLTSLVDNQFENNGNLEYLDFAGNTSIEYLNSTVFSYIPNLQTVILPSSLVTLQSATATYKNNVVDKLTTTDTSFLVNNKSLVEVDFDGNTTMTEIYTETFKDCIDLEVVYLPYSLITIESMAFSGCSSLRNIELAATVSEIETQAFYNCSSLTTVIFMVNSSTYTSDLSTIGSEAFAGCTSLVDSSMINFATILYYNEVTIGEYAFDSSSNYYNSSQQIL